MKRLAVFSITGVLLAAFSAPVFAARDAVLPSVWWSVTEQARTADGGMVVSLGLVIPQNVYIRDSEIFYVSTPSFGAGGARETGKPEAYRLKSGGFAVSGAKTVRIYSGRSERIDLIGKFEIEGDVYYAKTIFSCYGESGLSYPDAEHVDSAPDWGMNIVPGAANFYYRFQTGEPIAVDTGSPGSVVNIFENGAFLTTIPSDSEGICSYTAHHDKSLAKSGYRSKKDITFEIVSPDGLSVSSLTLPIYRSYYGQTSMAGGLSVLCASSLLGLVFVLIAGRRFRWQ